MQLQVVTELVRTTLRTLLHSPMQTDISRSTQGSGNRGRGRTKEATWSSQGAATYCWKPLATQLPMGRCGCGGRIWQLSCVLPTLGLVLLQPVDICSLWFCAWCCLWAVYGFLWNRRQMTWGCWADRWSEFRSELLHGGYALTNYFNLSFFRFSSS